MISEIYHIPVLLKETIELLHIKKTGTYIDATAGGGGHSQEIIKLIGPNGKLICFDKDPDAINYLNKKFKANKNVTIIKSDFKNIKFELDTLKISEIDGVIFDLGVSSYQLDNKERGFSYNQEAKLDMRMSKSGLSAYDIVNRFELDELSKIFFKYGEEKFSKQIAKNIILKRKIKPIETTYELSEIIKQSIPAPARRKGGNPSKRIFQAIRIAVNDELDSLSKGLKFAFHKLKIGGRLCVITFHSLEDRIVKQQFISLSQGCICPADFPICVCKKKILAHIVNKKPIIPSQSEIINNSRSKSAKLRVIEKISN